MSLQKENEILKKKLALAEHFIQREFTSHQTHIQKQKIGFQTEKQKKNFFNEDVSELAYNSIHSYFWAANMLGIENSVIQNIILAETMYYHFLDHKNLDGFAVLSSYAKAIDIYVEAYITKPFRKFSNKNKQKLTLNTLIEKNLYRVIYKWHTLSLWRLYEILSHQESYQEDTFLWDFKKFLDSYRYIKNIILEPSFLALFKELIDSGVFGVKRHIGVVSFEELQQIRKLLVWNFVDTNSLLYKLVQIGKIDG